MGQYYLVANIDKKQYMQSNYGLKLMEWSYNRNDLILSLAKKLSNEWKGDRVFVIGDYALSKDRIDEENSKDYDYNLLNDLEKELNIKDEKVDGYDVTIYDFVRDNFKKVAINELKNEEYKYIYNHNKKEFINLNHCPLAWLYKENREYYEVKVSPLSLLIALGNGMGGGDYGGYNEKFVGKYIDDVKNLELTKEPLNVEYNEFRPEFYEFSYVPYNEIPKEIEFEKKKEKIAKEIISFMYNYDSKNFKNYYKNKQNAIESISYSLADKADERIADINRIIENSVDENATEMALNLISKITECKLEKIARSNKNKSELEFKTQVDDNKYINETYKRIFEDLKMKNIESVVTTNSSTEITFETQEKLSIKTEDKDSIEELIKNTREVLEMSKNQEEIIKNYQAKASQIENQKVDDEESI